MLRKAGLSRQAALFSAVHTQGVPVASAATIALPDPSCDISGTETITAIAGLPVGQIRRVRFLGACTLTYNATSLILPGGADITCAANDTAEFQSLGNANWVCSRYMLASGTILGIVPIPKGGTGQTTAVAAKDALTVKSTDISSATSDLSAATGELVFITGTTTITSFGTVAAGALRSVKFTGALTLTHNATSLILPTGANITTAANDRAELRSLGSGNWICTSYTLADGTVLGTVPIAKGGTSKTSIITAYDVFHTQSTDIASATTTDLSAATGEFVTITGSATIEGFSSQPAGTVRRIRFTGNPLLVYDAINFILPGEGDIPVAVNDTAEFLSLGSGNWFCFKYTPSSLGVSNPSVFSGRLSGEQLLTSISSNKIANDHTAIETIYYSPLNGQHLTVSTEAFFYSMPRMYTLAEAPSIGLTQAQTGTTTDTSTSVTGLTSTAQLICGMAVSGTGIAGGTTISQITSATAITLSAAATASGSVTLTFKLLANYNYDIFAIWLDNELQLRFGGKWTTEGDRTDPSIEPHAYSGIYVNDDVMGATDSAQGGTPNQIAANVATYLGTIRTTATAGQTEDSTSHRFVWNAYNRKERMLKVVDTTDSWTQATTATWRQANDSSANQFDFVIGLLEDLVEATASAMVVPNSDRKAATGIGVDATNANSAQIVSGVRDGSGNPSQNALAIYKGYPGIGYHYLAWLEIGSASTLTWYGDDGVAYLQSGMIGTIWG